MSNNQNTVLAPVTDHGTRIAMWISSWQDNMPVGGHGSMIENPILIPGDPQNPPAPGAVLKWASRFNRAQLAPCAETPAITHEKEQEVLYVVRGKGMFQSEDKSEAIGPGVAILIPAGVPHSIENTSITDHLEVLWLAEQLEDDASPAKELIVRDTKKLPIAVGAHWVHVGKIVFNGNDGLTKIDAVNIATIPAMSIAEPHSHGINQEEVWYQMHGDSYLFLGRTLQLQKEGTAFMCPPDGCTPHSSINITNNPVDFFFFAHW
ncbi:MAG: cupin domain-containing protein [Deltaproteobacteria bacterium]|nr:cupin domain-containing protein [Deltaproteobacteria bacterium]